MTRWAKRSKGFKLGEKKTAEELAKLDAKDESLARWKASLGLGPGGAAHVDTSGPKVGTAKLDKVPISDYARDRLPYTRST